MKKILTIVCVSLLFISCSQKAQEAFKDINVGNSISTSAKEVEKSSHEIRIETGSIKNSASTIDKEATDIRLKTTEIDIISPHIESIEKHAGNIIKYSENIDSKTVELDTAVLSLKSLQANLKAIQDQHDKAVEAAKKAIEERDKALDERNQMERNMLTWLILASIVGVGISIALVFFGNFFGIGTAVACIGTLITAATYQKYSEYFAYVGAGMAILVCGILIYQVFVYKRGFKEIVSTTEAAKKRLLPADRKIIFGDGPEPGVAYMLQSTSTENIVKKEREKLKPMIEKTLNYDIAN